MGINFADVKAGESNGFSPIDEGRYTVIVEEAKPGISKNGNEKLSLTMKILGNDAYKNRKLWGDLTITEKALPFFKEFLVAINSEYAEANNVELRDVAIEVKNKKCSVYTKPEPYGDGKIRNKVSIYRPLDDDDDTSVAEEPVTPKKAMFS